MTMGSFKLPAEETAVDIVAEAGYQDMVTRTAGAW